MEVFIEMRSLLLALSLLLLGSFGAFAAAVCPGAMGANNFAHPPDASASGCNVIITINANSSLTITTPDSNPYDGSEDALIGVVNNSSSTVTALTLNGNDIFGFDGDGICTYSFVGSGYCASLPKDTFGNIQDPGDYQGPTSKFSVSNANAGTVNFSPGIAANGGTAYFSLEGVPGTTGLSGSVSGSGPTTTVPALSTWGLLLLALSLAAFSVRMIVRA